MRKIFTLILGVLFVSAAFAQLERPTALIKKAEVKPVIDGVFDEVWATTDSFVIDRPYDTANGAPTLGEPGETYWKALWDEEGYYLIIKVTDDNYWPNYLSGGANAWEFDKPEIYFDVNFNLQDGFGPSAQNSGHHQMAPDMTASKENGQLNTEDNTRQHAFKVEAPNYVAEYFVPWASLTNSEGGGVDLEAEIGFDITINDSDPDNTPRRRGVWANVGPDATEAWVNMDQCGIITLEGAQVIYVTDVNISVDGANTGAITEDNQQLQINVEVLPVDATVKSVKWKVRRADGGMVRASISPSGLITPVTDEELIIYASDATDFVDSQEITVSITGQKDTREEVNYIKNGNFDVVTETGAPGAPWTGGSSVVDGVLNITNTNGQGTDPWSWTVSQRLRIPEAVKDEPFMLSLKLWTAEVDTFYCDLEFAGDPYTRFGASSDPKADNGTSQWMWPDLSTEPTVYEIAIENFSAMQTGEGAIGHVFNLFAGRTNATVYLDSIYLVSLADLELVSTAVSQVKAMESFKVYPNPATSKLNVELSAINAKVEIYNSVGVKMDEAVVLGNRHIFDVSRYTKGLYFVKANGAVVKFIK